MGAGAMGAGAAAGGAVFGRARLRARRASTAIESVSAVTSASSLPLWVGGASSGYCKVLGLIAVYLEV